MIKGAILIVLAVLLGGFLLFNGVDDDGGSEVVAGADSTSDDTEPADTTEPSNTTAPPTSAGPTTTSDEGTPDRSDVTVLVANAAGIPGAAGRVSQDLADAGFSTTDPVNATAPVTTTAVYYVSGEEAAALDVADALGLDSTAVEEMPDVPPVADLRGATVLVVLGPDIAPTT